MHVLKFGGTSMGDEHTWRQILDIITGYRRPVIIVSATARTTRQLIAAAEMAVEDLNNAKEIGAKIRQRHEQLVQQFLATNAENNSTDIEQRCMDWIDRCISNLESRLEEIADQKTISLATKDAIASIGEQLSAYLFAQCGRAFGLSTKWVDARKVIKTDSSFGQAVPDISQIKKNIYRLRESVESSIIPVMGGFYGESMNGEITTLGFEGSDYTASLAGGALNAEAIEIWTDVSGIYTCDPRVVDGARPIPELSFQEATELAYFGAKVLHPSTMKPAAAAGIPIFVKNIFEPDQPGTKIHDQQIQNGWAKAITYLSNVLILTVTANGAGEGHRFLAEVFRLLDEAKLPVNAVTTTEASVSVALNDNDRIDSLRESLAVLGTVEMQSAQGLISLIGCSFTNINTIQDRVLKSITETTPTLISYSKTKQNLNLAVPETEVIPAVCRIHDLLFNE